MASLEIEMRKQLLPVRPMHIISNDSRLRRQNLGSPRIPGWKSPPAFVDTNPESAANSCIVLRSGGISAIFGWHVRRATVDWQVHLHAGNSAGNCQPPRGLHPELIGSTTAASQGHQFPLAQSPCPPLLPLPAPTSRAVTGQAHARHYRQFPNPLFSTSSRAIAVSMSSSPSIAWRPSEANLPSMANATNSFLPIRRRQTSCIVPA